MIRIRQIYSTSLWSDREAIGQVQEIFRLQNIRRGAAAFFTGLADGQPAH